MATTTKTAVSFPTALLRKFDALARRRKVSRSALVSEAVESLLKRHEADEITRSYDEFYRDEDQDMTVVRQMKATHRRIVERE